MLKNHIKPNIVLLLQNQVEHQHCHSREYNSEDTIPDSGMLIRIVLEISARSEYQRAHKGFLYLFEAPGVTGYQQRMSV